MKIMTNIPFLGFLCPVLLTLATLLNASEESVPVNDDEIVEEVIVTAEPVNIELAAEDEVLLFYDAHKKGADLYKRRKYDEAKPYLLVTAKMGFKMSQARLGHIYLMGLGSTPKDAVKAIGWFGVAAEPTTTPGIRNQYRKLLKQIPSSQMQTVQRIVDDYIAKYGNSATGTKCNMIRSAGTHLATISCEVKDVYKFRNSFWHDQAWCFFNPENCGQLPQGGG